MDYQELKTKSTAELKEIFLEQVQLLRDLRFKLANQQLKTFGKIKEAKKTAARIRMLLKVKQTESNK